MGDEQDCRKPVVQHAETGSALLAPLMVEAGFDGPEITLGGGSGGSAAVAVWQRPDGLRVETHVRFSLGIVRYSWHGESFEHPDYLRFKGQRGQYPRFSDRPDEAFGHLLADLEGPAADLLTMSEEEFAAAARAVQRLPKPGLP